MKKQWWKSKTIWLNVAAGGIAYLAGQWDAVASHLPTWAGPAFGSLVAAANVGLRFVTTDALVLKRLDPEDQ